MFNIHIVQALHGDCTLVEYGSADAPRCLLIDGGPSGAFEFLRPVLADLAARGRHLDPVVLTHSDDDHVVGLVDFFTALRQQQAAGQPALIPVDNAWINHFAFDATVAPSMASIPPVATTGLVEPDAEGRFPDLGYAEAIDLRTLMGQLNIPVNGGFAHGLVALDTAPATLALGNLTLQFVGPTEKNLERMRLEWDAYVAEHPPGVAAVPVEVEVVPERVSPDQSIPNRSSIMFVVESDGRRALLTGDGRSGDILRGLTRVGLLPKEGGLHVDVFKLPHHGSARNASQRLFERVTADTYVISANGRDGNPDFPTLVWLVRAIKAQGRNARLIATNPTPTLERLVSDFPPDEWGYALDLLPPESTHVAISLD
jgi:hypothetical protein